MRLPVGDGERRRAEETGNGMGNLPPLGQISFVLLSALGLASNRVWPSAFSKLDLPHCQLSILLNRYITVA